MLTRSADRLWVIGGAVGAVVLLVAGWFLLIHPQNGQTSSLRTQSDAAEARLVTLRHRLVELREENGDLAAYRAQLSRDEAALPQAAGTAAFLRELQAAGDRRGVAVTGVVVGSPELVTGAATETYALPVTLTATGSAAGVREFVRQLQRVQPRAVLVTGVTAVPADRSGSLTGTITVSITLKAFVVPGPAGTATPPVAAATPTG